MLRRGDEAGAQDIIFRVAVVAQQTGGGDDQRAVFAEGVAFAGSNGRVVDPQDGNRDGGGGGQQAVADGVVEELFGLFAGRQVLELAGRIIVKMGRARIEARHRAEPKGSDFAIGMQFQHFDKILAAEVAG